MRSPVLPVLLVCALAAGCGGDDAPRPAAGSLGIPTAVADDPELRAVPIGVGPRFRPGPGSAAPGPCLPEATPRFGAHVEVFAAGRVVVVPAGIGVPGGRRDGAYVRPADCSGRLRTVEPTGVVEVAEGTRATLADLFAAWEQPLGRTRLAGHRGVVRAWVAGERWRGDPRAIPLARHAQIVLAVGPEVPVHRTFRFREGL